MLLFRQELVKFSFGRGSFWPTFLFTYKKCLKTANFSEFIGPTQMITDNRWHPILERRIPVLLLLLLLLLCHAQGTPPNSATGWTGELWSKTKFLILEN